MAVSWRHFRRLAAVVALATLSLTPAAAEDGEVLVRPSFTLVPTTVEIAAVHKYARDFETRAERAGRPLHLKIAINQSTTLISLQSVAVCDTTAGCPLLVFRAIDLPPVLKTTSYQNVTLAYRGAKTFLILKTSGPDQECLLPRSGRARCKVVK